MAMQFWGVEVKENEPCEVEDGSIIHLSQVTLSYIKKDKEIVTVHVKVGDKKFVLGMLSQDTPRLTFDLVFEKDFEISHNSKNGSIHLMGYQAVGEDDSESELDYADEEEVDTRLAKDNGQLAAPAAKLRAALPKVDNKLKPEAKVESDDDDEIDSDDDESDSDDDEMSGSDDDDEDADGSDEETPAKMADAGKKRPNGDAKTPTQSKKAKIATPQNTDGKKAAQPTTPSAKKGGKGDKTPKSDGSSVSCGSCKKTFKSEPALESHSKAKHGAK